MGGPPGKAFEPEQRKCTDMQIDDLVQVGRRQ